MSTGRRLSEWFAPGAEKPPSLEVIAPSADTATLVLEPVNAHARREPSRQPEPTPDFDSITFTHNRRQYVVDAVEVPTGANGDLVRHWRLTVDGVVEHTLRAMPHEDPESLEQRAIRTLEETAAGAVRGLDFEYQGRLYHLEDRSDALSRDSLGDTAMWCLTCDGVMEGSFPAPADETDSVLRARAIQIARRSGEYRARLNSKREKSNRQPYRTAGPMPPPRRRTPPRGRILDPLETEPAPRQTQAVVAPVVKQVAVPPAPQSKAPAAPPSITPLDRLIATSPTPALKDGAGPGNPRLAAQVQRMLSPERAKSVSGQNGSKPEKPAASEQPITRPLGAETERPGTTAGPEVQAVSNPRTETSGPLPRTSNPRISQPRISQPRVSQPRISSPRISRPSIPSRQPRPKRRGGAWKAIRGLYAITAAIVLFPVRAFRKPPARNRGSKEIRSAHEWIESTPVRMLLPYSVGAIVLLGFLPFVVSLWIAGGLMALGLLMGRRSKRPEPFQLQTHHFARHPAYTPQVEVHSTKGPVGDPRMSTRRRATAPQRILQSANRQ